MAQYLIGGKLVESFVPVDPTSGQLMFSHSAIDVSLNAIPGVTAFSNAGFKSSVDSSTGSIIEEVATTLVSNAAGEAMSIVSSSASDVGVVLLVSALGPNYANLAPFTVTLNGTTPVALPGLLTRINRLARVSGDLVGNATVTSSSQTRAVITAGQQMSRSSRFTIPTNFRLHVGSLLISMVKDTGSTNSLRMSLRAKPPASTGYGEIIAAALERDGTSSFLATQAYSPGLTGPLDVCSFGLASVANLDAEVYMTAMLVDTTVHP